MPTSLFQGIDDTLARAKRALLSARSDDLSERSAGIRDVIVYGRSVTFALQTLRDKVHPDFDAWYTKYKNEMKKSELMTISKDMRNEILKQGHLKTVPRIAVWRSRKGPLGLPGWHCSPTHMYDDLEADKPIGAIETFVGDEVGGSGWLVKQEDGSIEKVYANLADPSIEFNISLPQNVVTHLGISCGPDIIELCEIYIEYLNKMVMDARKTFSEV